MELPRNPQGWPQCDTAGPKLSVFLAGVVSDGWICQVNCESEGDQGRWETDRCLYNLIPGGSSIIPLFGAHYDYQKKVTMSRPQFREWKYVSL